MTENKFDLIVIGGGPAGYVGSIRAAQLGMKVACVDARKTLGGTCLNVGCIPSKALLNISEKFSEISSKGFADLGIKVQSSKLDLNQVMNKKNEIVSSLTSGIDFLMKKNKITRLNGKAKFKNNKVISVINSDESKDYTADKILIATGSIPSSIPGVEIDEKKIVSSTGALEFSSIPKKLVVIGAGYIGLEMGTVWSRLGSDVEIIEFLPRILPGMDLELANNFEKIIRKKGLKLNLNTAVKKAKINKTDVTLTIEDQKDKKEREISCDKVLVATGRQPNIENLGIKELGIKLTEKGQIIVDEDFETNVDGIFAVGDVILGPMLAHKAEEDAVAAVEIMSGQSGHVDYDLVPGVVYTAPEIATLGHTEEFLKEKGVEYNKGVFPFLANSRAKAIGHTEGFVKILADSKSDRVLGCHIISHDAGTLIHEVATAMSFGASSEDIARTCHAHPTMNEAVKEAALAVEKRAVHI